MEERNPHIVCTLQRSLAPKRSVLLKGRLAYFREAEMKWGNAEREREIQGSPQCLSGVPWKAADSHKRITFST